jgi:hypothetical protein
MTVIDGIGKAGPLPSRAGRTRGGGVAWPGVSGPPADSGSAAATGGSAPALALDGLLALQEAMDAPPPDPLERERTARRHGQRLLAGLAGLQRELLGGGDSVEAALTDLRTLVEAEPPPADPALAATLAAIRLRVRVELARRGL